MKVHQMRKATGVTQAELAALCRTSQQQIAKIEMGRVDPKLSTLRRIALALRCEVRDLLWTRKEFLREIQRVLKTHGIRPKDIDLVSLNNLCAADRAIIPFHPFWEELESRNNTLAFKEEL